MTDSNSDQEKNTREIVYVPANYPAQEDEDEIDLLELWNVLWKGKWFVFTLALLCTFAAVVISLFVLPETFKSTAVLRPLGAQGGISSKLSGLAANLPVSLPSKTGGKTQTILSFLQSRNLQKRLIQEYDLLPHIYRNKWNPETGQWDVERPQDKPTIVQALQTNALGNYLKISKNEETGLITIKWLDKDPVFAKKMVQAVIQEVRFYLENEYKTDAQRELEFVKKQLDKATRELEYWEKQVPSEDLTLSKIQRELQAARQVYTELRKQVELAKISAAKEVVRFKVLDSPFVPEEEYKPQRSLICALSMVTSGFIGIFLVFFRQFIINVRKRNHTNGG